MNDWQRFNETSLPDIKEFYSNLNIEDITNEDCKHAIVGKGGHPPPF